MERRDFLRIGGLSTLGFTAPSVAAAAPEPVDELAVEVAALNLDAGMRAIRSNIQRQIASEGSLAGRPDLKAAMGTLVGGTYAYQAFSELPLEMQVHPEMQQRLHQAGEDIDRGADALGAALDENTEAEWQALERIWSRASDKQASTQQAELAYARNGGSLAGRRRFHRLTDMVRRDVSRRGFRQTFTDYFEQIETARLTAQNRTASPALQQRAEKAHRRWEKVDERRRAKNKEPLAKPAVRYRRWGAVGLRVLGVINITLGVTGLVLGVIALNPDLGCICAGIALILLGILGILHGAAQLRWAKGLSDKADALEAEDKRTEEAEATSESVEDLKKRIADLEKQVEEAKAAEEPPPEEAAPPAEEPAPEEAPEPEAAPVP